MEGYMQNFNYHTHTYRCKHADINLTDEDYVLEFIKQKFKRICFTDHCPEKNKIDLRTNMRMDYSEKDEYLESIKNLKEKYQNDIKIEVGYEVEYLPDDEENLFALKKESDKIILGQHFIYGDDKKLRIFRQADFTDKELLRYASYIETAMKKGLPDIIAHPDIYMLNRNNFGIIESQVAHIICAAAEKYQIPLEINLSHPCLFYRHQRKNIIYPNKEFWQIASNYNIKVVYGIDAHFKQQITYYKESIDVANNYLGLDTISKLHFCNEDLI